MTTGTRFPEVFVCRDSKTGKDYLVHGSRVTWTDLLAWREARARDVRRARGPMGRQRAGRRLHVTDVQIEALRPFMSDEPLMTLAEGVRLCHELQAFVDAPELGGATVETKPAKRGAVSIAVNAFGELLAGVRDPDARGRLTDAAAAWLADTEEASTDERKAL